MVEYYQLLPVPKTFSQRTHIVNDSVLTAWVTSYLLDNGKFAPNLFPYFLIVSCIPSSTIQHSIRRGSDYLYKIAHCTSWVRSRSGCGSPCSRLARIAPCTTHCSIWIDSTQGVYIVARTIICDTEVYCISGDSSIYNPRNTVGRT